MLSVAIWFFILAIIAALAGVTGLAVAFGNLAYYAAVAFLVIAVISLAFERRTPGPPVY
jgi:uncharacterized membrane protein YtjA (UPF0391 family)